MFCKALEPFSVGVLVRTSLDVGAVWWPSPRCHGARTWQGPPPPEIFLPSTTRRLPEARSRNGPQATYRVNSSGPWVEASCARLRQTALARNLRSFSRWASYKHHAMLVCFLRPFRVTDSNSFWRMRFNSCVNSPNGGGLANWPHHRVQPARVGGEIFARTVCGDPTVHVSSGGLCWADEPRSC